LSRAGGISITQIKSGCAAIRISQASYLITPVTGREVFYIYDLAFFIKESLDILKNNLTNL
jgi:hypothetical protein